MFSFQMCQRIIINRVLAGVLQNILRCAQNSPGGDKSAASPGGALPSRYGAGDQLASDARCHEPSIKFRHTDKSEQSIGETTQKFQRVHYGEHPRRFMCFDIAVGVQPFQREKGLSVVPVNFLIFLACTLLK